MTPTTHIERLHSVLAEHVGQPLTPALVAQIEARVASTTAWDSFEVACVCGGDWQAAELIGKVWAFVEVWDDAIDGEKNETDEAIHEAFLFALFGLHRDPFFAKHRQALEPAFMLMVAEWQASNVLQRSGVDEAVRTAHFLRCSPFTFFVAVAMAAGGLAAARRAAIYFRTLPQADKQDDFVAEQAAKG